MSSPSPYISKTDFLEYQHCPGYAWHARYRPELLPPPDQSTRRKMRDGQAIERLAQQLFPDGILIRSGAPIDTAAHTQATMATGAAIIYQATAVAETGIQARADVLLRIDGGWHLIEIKSSSTDPANTTSVVKKHLDDVTFQTIAFRQSGIPIVRSSILVINRTFRRNGAIAPDQLFLLVDVTTEVQAHESLLVPLIEDATAILLNDRVPATCECHRKTRINRCDLFRYFHPDIPDKGTIYHIANIQRHTLLPALDRGVMMIADWPDDLRLGPKQWRQIELTRRGREEVHYDHLANFLTYLTPPLWYLDYETFQNGIPRWNGYGPHQQITFQYSLHCWDDGFDEPLHFAYLAESAEDDPTINLLDQLARDLGPEGSVVVWNKSFEHDRNVEMAERYPRYAEFLHNVNQRMVDLGDPVKDGWWAHPEFQGSWSLKQVLPVVAPDLSYKDLEIGDGGTASERWMQAVLDSPCELSDTERSNVLEALRIYSAQDTLAMYRIWTYMHGLLTKAPI